MSTYVENVQFSKTCLSIQLLPSDTPLRLTLHSWSTVHKLENDGQFFFEDLLFQFWGFIIFHKIYKGPEQF